LLTYSRRVLFDPLGFGATAWHKGNDGACRAASGLRLLPPDLVKIGQLVLAHEEVELPVVEHVAALDLHRHREIGPRSADDSVNAHVAERQEDVEAAAAGEPAPLDSLSAPPPPVPS